MLQSTLFDPIVILAIILAIVFLILGVIVIMRLWLFPSTQEERDRLQKHNGKPLTPDELMKDEERRKRMKQKYYT
jgi:hypothetical protein